MCVEVGGRAGEAEVRGLVARIRKLDDVGVVRRVDIHAPATGGHLQRPGRRPPRRAGGVRLHSAQQGAGVVCDLEVADAAADRLVPLHEPIEVRVAREPDL